MIISGENILLVSSLLLIVEVLIGRSSYRTGLPLLLVFLIVGMLFGTDGVGFHFDDMHTAQFGGMVALCIILFSGGLSTSVRAVRPVIAPGLVLSTAGVLLTALLTGGLTLLTRAVRSPSSSAWRLTKRCLPNSRRLCFRKMTSQGATRWPTFICR